MIEVKNVTKRYGKFVAVEDISFEVKKNEIVGFLGPNGAGKSTTMNMITGYIEPSKGRIIVNGYDVSKQPKKAKMQIGYMPENVPLYNELTVKEFIKFMAELKNVKRKERKSQVEKVIKETGLESVQKKLIKNISRGYKQRVSLAGALMGNPDILILDEPTVGLDPKQIIEIRNLIKSLGKNHTVFISSHILSEISQVCERVVIINKGKILAIDTPSHLEKQTQAENSLVITVEDKENKMETIKKKITEIKEIKLIKDNEDGTKQYLVTSNKDTDIRKKLFTTLPKEDITIFELKQSEATLEDAFLKVINNKETEIQNAKKEEETKKKKRQDEISKMNKKDRKKAIKADKKEEKQEAKDAFNREWEKDKLLRQQEKEDKQKLKEEKREAKNNKKQNEKTQNTSKKSSQNKTANKAKAQVNSQNSAQTKTQTTAKTQAKTQKSTKTNTQSKPQTKSNSTNKKVSNNTKKQNNKKGGKN